MHSGYIRLHRPIKICYTCFYRFDKIIDDLCVLIANCYMHLKCNRFCSDVCFYVVFHYGDYWMICLHENNKTICDAVAYYLNKLLYIHI
jgi:hypothetical protein